MNRYIKSLLERFCYEELHYLFVRTSNPLKEITESYSPYSLFKQKGIELNGKTIYHLGDGSKCTTGALFTFLTKSFNLSIDPVVNEKVMKEWIAKYQVTGFEYRKQLFEDVDYSDFADPDIIVCVHSHVSMVEIDKKFPNWKYIYTSPCCCYEKQTFDIEYMQNNNIEVVLAGTDKYILSNKNKIFIYKNNRREN